MPGTTTGAASDGLPEEHRKHQPARTTLGTQSGRVWVVLALFAFGPLAFGWFQSFATIPEDGWAGGDFGVFYTAGTLVADGDSELLYDVDAFQNQYEESIGGVPWAAAVFANPPAFALVLAPLTLLPLQAASIGWTMLSLAALAVALACMGVRRVLLVAGVLLFTLPGFFAVTNGQSTFFWLLIVAGVFISLERGSKVVGGALAGLLILKPPLLIGFVLWWLIDRRMRRSLLATAASATAIVIVTLPFVGRAWFEYPIAVFSFADMHRTSSGQSAQFSPWGFIDLLSPGHPVIAASIGIAASVFGVAAFVVFYRQHRDEWPLLFGAAIVATLWISPHVLTHDWVLLVIPLAVLWRERNEQAGSWMTAAITLAFVALWSYTVTFLMRESVEWTIQYAVPVLAAVAWFIALNLRHTKTVDSKTRH